MVGYCEDGVSAGIWVIHTGAKSGGELVPNLGVSWSRFLAVTVMIV